MVEFPLSYSHTFYTVSDGMLGGAGEHGYIIAESVKRCAKL